MLFGLRKLFNGLRYTYYGFCLCVADRQRHPTTPGDVSAQFLTPLLHAQNSPKPSLPTHHVLECLIRLAQWELLYHTLDAVQLRKVDCFFRVQRVA